MDYIKGIINNDRKVLQEIYDNFFVICKTNIIQSGGGIQDAQDIFQDALLVIYKKIHKSDFDLTSSFSSYLFGVCKFLWMNKKRKNSKELITNQFEETLIDNEDMISVMIEVQRQNFYLDYFDKLSEKCREVLQLSFQSISGKEIAKILNYSEEYVRTKKYTCKNKLFSMIRNAKWYKEHLY